MPEIVRQAAAHNDAADVALKPASSTTVKARVNESHAQSDWVAIAQWQQCPAMERPGIVFEIQNAAGQSMFTQCVVPMPPPPFVWASPPVRFRAVTEQPPEHSTPIPPPKG